MDAHGVLRVAGEESARRREEESTSSSSSSSSSSSCFSHIPFTGVDAHPFMEAPRGGGVVCRGDDALQVDALHYETLDPVVLVRHPETTSESRFRISFCSACLNLTR
jgi:hypothetical protein